MKGGGVQNRHVWDDFREVFVKDSTSVLLQIWKTIATNKLVIEWIEYLKVITN